MAAGGSVESVRMRVLRFAMCIHEMFQCCQGNHIFTSGATGTNAAVIRGALKAEKPDLLTVVLPQSLSKQPPESQELLLAVRSKPAFLHTFLSRSYLKLDT